MSKSTLVYPDHMVQSAFDNYEPFKIYFGWGEGGRFGGSVTRLAQLYNSCQLCNLLNKKIKGIEKGIKERKLNNGNAIRQCIPVMSQQHIWACEPGANKLSLSLLHILLLLLLLPLNFSHISSRCLCFLNGRARLVKRFMRRKSCLRRRFWNS